MNPNIPIVRELQLIDCRIRELTEEIARLPRYISEIENKLESHKVARAKDQAALEENRKARRLMDGNISTCEQKMSQLRVQMGEAKTNTQFRAFQKEIEFSENEIRKTEDRILDKMVEAEKLENNVEEAAKALQAEKLVVAEEVGRVNAQVSKDENELATVKNTREQLTTGISPQVLTLYTRVSKARQGIAVASVSDERCMACNVVLRPHLTQKLRLGEEILTCESCGRILYRGNLQETPLEDPAGESNIVA